MAWNRKHRRITELEAALASALDCAEEATAVAVPDWSLRQLVQDPTAARPSLAPVQEAS